MNGIINKPKRPAIGADWDEKTWREVGNRVLELAIGSSTNWDQRKPAPTGAEDILSMFSETLPEEPMGIDQLINLVEEEVIPGAAFNGHPSWFAYITGAPLPISVIGDLLESALNRSVALWRLSPAATAIELQAIEGIREMVGFPARAEGIFVSGGQMANILAHTVMRDVKTPWDTRQFGMRCPNGNAPRLRIYASAETHYCHPQAAELLGLGQESVRLVPTDDRYMMRIDALREMIAADRAKGDLPVAVVGTAGTVGTGAVDPLAEIRVVADEEDLWFHVDGAYGAFAALSPNRPPELDGMALADSIACDPH
nr:aspartate aminotransferase family protein [Chloroflexota bacterium]